MKQFTKYVILASLSTIISHSPASKIYSAMDASEDPVAAPARASAPTLVDVSQVNRKPAVEPRVYVENVNAKSGYTYYDYADQKPSREQHPPSQK
jgi:hypothetical protein